MPATQTILNRACAECRRLKLKCDRNSPCSACVRRGCSSICPDGQLVAGKGTRYVLSNTKELHNKIETLQARIKALETALAELQSKFTSEPHPLLLRSLEGINESSKLDDQTSKDVGSDDEDLIDTFGSLTVDTKGETIWYGPHAGSEFLIPRKDNKHGTEARLELPIDVLLLSKQFPFKNVSEVEDLARKFIRSCIPTQNEAWESIFGAHSQLTWATSAAVWEEHRRIMFDPIYDPETVASDQQVAVFFLIMALCTLADPKRPVYHPDAHLYYHLSRASMSLGDDIFQSRSLYAIQYLHLFSAYNTIANDPNGLDKASVALSMAIRLAQMAGLHRDNEQWDKYPQQAEYRRRLWWDLISAETDIGFIMGRPRAINPIQYDTKMPKDDEDEGKIPSFSRVKYRWIRDCLGGVLDEAFAVKSPSYTRILKLDKNLRDWELANMTVPNDLLKAKVGEDRAFLYFLIRFLSTTGLREIALMYLHRRYFVEALVKESNEPLRSKYAMSVWAVHRSCTLLLQGIVRLNSIVEHLFSRTSFMWVHGLSAYVCLSAIVIKSPGCSLAPSSLAEIDQIKDAFARVTSYRVAHAQPTLVKLHEQAHLAMNRYKEGNWPPKGSSSEAGVDEDVMKFIGRRDFVATKSQETTRQVVTGDCTEDITQNGVHPALYEYMQWFGDRPENNANGPLTYSAQTSAPNFFSQPGAIPPAIPRPATNTGTFESYLPETLLMEVNNMNTLGSRTGLSDLTSHASDSTSWASSNSSNDPSLLFDPSQDHGLNVPSQPFLFDDLPLEPATEPSCGAGQQSLDQVWDQFLSTLMS
ncbi:hypothetical protein CPB86DRAFT_780150 [Serendipita vermifera]|nr:hypothetical protein CPB86DRAFT_780150 [Serendipita vermifera]